MTIFDKLKVDHKYAYVIMHAEVQWLWRRKCLENDELQNKLSTSKRKTITIWSPILKISIGQVRHAYLPALFGIFFVHAEQLEGS